MNITDTTLGQAFAQLTSEFSDRDARITELETELQNVRDESAGRASQITGLQQQIDENNTAMAQLNSDKNEAATAFQSQIDTLTQQLADANAEIARLNNP